jgi:hypothetical protein
LVLGHDDDRVAKLSQDFETSPRKLELSLDRLIGVGHSADRDHPGLPLRRSKLRAEQLGRVFSVARDQRTERDVERVFRLFKRYASIDFARATLQQTVQAALDEFDVAYRDAPPSMDRDFIRGLIPFLGERDI